MKKRVISLALLIVVGLAVWQWMGVGESIEDPITAGEPYSRMHFMKEIASASELLGLQRGVAMAGGEDRVTIPGMKSAGSRGREVQKAAGDVFGRITKFTVQSEQSFDMASIARYIIHVYHRDGIARSIEIHRVGGVAAVASMLQEDLSRRFPKIACRVVSPATKG